MALTLVHTGNILTMNGYRGQKITIEGAMNATKAVEIAEARYPGAKIVNMKPEYQ